MSTLLQLLPVAAAHLSIPQVLQGIRILLSLMRCFLFSPTLMNKSSYFSESQDILFLPLSVSFFPVWSWTYFLIILTYLLRLCHLDHSHPLHPKTFPCPLLRPQCDSTSGVVFSVHFSYPYPHGYVMDIITTLTASEIRTEIGPFLIACPTALSQLYSQCWLLTSLLSFSIIWHPCRKLFQHSALTIS